MKKKVNMCSISCNYPLAQTLNGQCEMKSWSSSFDCTPSTDVSTVPPPHPSSQKVSAQSAEILQSFSHKWSEFHPDMELLGFTSAGDKWLFEGCTVSLQEASQKRQLWIVKVLTVSSLMATVSAEFSLGMYKMNRLWMFSWLDARTLPG